MPQPYRIAVVPQVCNNLLAGQAFQHAKVEQWSQLIVENVLKDVAANNDDAAKTVNGKFKYIGAPKLSSCSTPCRHCNHAPARVLSQSRATSSRRRVRR